MLLTGPGYEPPRIARAAILEGSREVFGVRLHLKGFARPWRPTNLGKGSGALVHYADYLRT